MVNATQPSKHSSSGAIDDALAEAVRAYRKRAHMTQGMFAFFAGITDAQVSKVEKHQSVSEATRVACRAFLEQAPAQRSPYRLSTVSNRLPNVYLTKKLLTWARITNQPSESIEAVRALKEAYEKAKRDEGLASIPLIQLEVENALSLATRGAYYRKRKG